VMREAAGRFDGGAVFVDLAPVRDPASAPDAILAAASASGLGSVASREQLMVRLAEAPVLLVLDNLEQIPGVGEVVTELLLGAESLTILATSRRRLRAPAEHLFSLEPFPVPRAGSVEPGAIAAVDSVAFLVDRARAFDPDFSLSASNAEPIAEICRRVDGLPLALELAAPHFRTLGVVAVLDRFERVLAADGAGTSGRDRHASMHAAIASSVDLLTPGARRLLAELSVFRGAFDVNAALAVASDGDGAIGTLEELVDGSLLVVSGDLDTETTYRMLEVIKEFAAAELRGASNLAAARRHHAEFHTELAEVYEAISGR
jgi:predicted ATPase